MRLRTEEPEIQAVYDAMARFRERSLQDLQSSFLSDDDPDCARVWSRESALELMSRFVDQPDESKRSFLEKLSDQMTGASRPAVQLLVELAWLHVVVSRVMKYDTKRTLLSEIAQMGDAALPHGDFDDALVAGIANTGISFNTRRPHQLWLLIRFVTEWVEAPSEQRAEWLADAWKFRELVFSLEGLADQTQRHALLHLVHPDVFEDCVSQNYKQKIAALAQPGEEGDNVDRTIANVRQRLSAEHGADFSFFGGAVRELWDAQEATEATADEPQIEELDDYSAVERSAWLVRGSGGRRIPEWLQRGVCAVYFEDSFPFEVRAGVTRDELRGASEAAGVDTTAGGFNAELGQVWRFVNAVAIGDYVVTVNGQDVYVGVVESGPHNVAGRTRKETYRSVEWLNVEQPIPRSSVSAAMYSKMRTLSTLTNVSSVLDDIERWVSGRSWEEPSERADAPPDAMGLSPATSGLCDYLELPDSWLNDVIGLLAHKRQLVFFGPPGTGKTFVAQALADHLTAAGGTTELVQFHPSYTYEDFFEGYRPVPATSGSIAFEIKPGPLRRLAEAALADPGVPHVLIVDEINRANLAKVFGELYFLLEYRDRAITLQYSDDEFSLPGNLYVIGTMNTADRSIALVDAAMRRRFYFVEMTPLAPPVDDLLGRWLRTRSLDDLPARLLAELNRRLDDPDAAIGPSYLMSPEISDRRHLERIWTHAILPLLQERFYGTGDDLDRYSLDAVEAGLDELTAT